KNWGQSPLLTQSFDELRPPANLALRVTFDVIYPSVPASPRVLQIRFRDLSVLDDCCASSRSQRLTLQAALMNRFWRLEFRFPSRLAFLLVWESTPVAGV